MSPYISSLEKLLQKNPSAFPKIGVLVVSYNASTLLIDTLNRIPQPLWKLLTEIFIFDDDSSDNTHHLAQVYASNSPWSNKISIYKNPKNIGYGGNQKVGYQYAIQKEMDYVILLHGDGQYAPECMPEIIHAAVIGNHEIVFGSRMINKKKALHDGMPVYKWLGNQVLTTAQNWILNMKMTEFHSGYRLYSIRFLQRINFMQNSNGFDFDTQIIIQSRIADIPIYELSIPTYYGKEICHVNGLDYAAKILLWCIRFRLHQLHMERLNIFITKDDSLYTRKYSPYSSHEQIIALCGDTQGKYVLDLGAADNLLSKHFHAQGANVICVDRTFSEDSKIDGVQYIVADLEKPLHIHGKRRFDYIIAADIVEHLRHAPQLISDLKNILKPDGKFIVSTPNIAIFIYRLSLLLGRFNYGPRGILDETHVRLYTYHSFIALLQNGGFRIVNVKPTSLPFEILFSSTGKSSLIRFMDRCYFALATLWKRMFAYQFVVECEITYLDAAGKSEGKVVQKL